MHKSTCLQPAMTSLRSGSRGDRLKRHVMPAHAAPSVSAAASLAAASSRRGARAQRDAGIAGIAAASKIRERLWSHWFPPRLSMKIFVAELTGSSATAKRSTPRSRGVALFYFPLKRHAQRAFPQHKEYEHTVFISQVCPGHKRHRALGR